MKRGILVLLVAAMWFGLGLALVPDAALGHANLASSDPASDALLVTSPDDIRMTFTEDVASNPAPDIRLLDVSGASVSKQPLAFQIDEENPRTLIVQVPSLDRGTWTVSWTVTSATDGHTLNGTWAFRIGGGLPPGQASTSDAAPAPWAVALRWLTFLGAAAAAGLLLFPMLTRPTEGTSHYARKMLRLALAATVLALLSSLLEPVGGWLADRSIPLSDHFAALPTAWTWRPLTLIPLVIGLSTFLWLRRPPGRYPAAIGAGLALASLLGLILTSHAAGREDSRTLALVVDALHQWSVALWTGGLLAFTVWVAARRSDGLEDSGEVRLQTVSNLALGLFVVALVTGVINTSFMLDLVERIRQDGFEREAFADLWESRYGLTLLVKSALLIVPFLLAWRHRRTIATVTAAAGTMVATLPRLMQRSLRWETALVTLVVLGGSTLAMSAPPAQEVPAVSDITLVAPTALPPSDDSMLVHLTVDPGQTGDNELTVRLSTWSGQPVDMNPGSRITLSFTSLSHGTQEGGVELNESPDGWTTSGLKLSLDGWWQVIATIQRPGAQNATASFVLMLPDPNTQGFDAPRATGTDPAAEALFDQSLDRMTRWTSLRWTELIGSGLDVLVIGELAVIDPVNDDTGAYSMDLIYSGSFAPNASGAPPPEPSFDSRSSVVVGDRGWMRTTTGVWLEETPVRYVPPSGWATTYAGATDFQMGEPQTIDGVEYQLLLFHLPEQTTAEAWFAWWIDPTTGNVMRINMISRMHYMTWLYRDIDEEIVIEPPSGQNGTLEAATPAS